MKVIICEPLKMARVEDIDNTLESMQEVVGGLIEFVYPPQLQEIDERLMLVCNEEGKLDGLRLSRPLYDTDGDLYDVIAGTCFITYDDGEGGCTDIPEAVIAWVMMRHDWRCYGTIMKLGGVYRWVLGGIEDEED